MYDQIFLIFEIIKKHCQSNGNKSFEESAVFELLENLFPIHGTEQTIQIVTEMLDAQRIRDCKDSSNENILEVLVSDKSNDADSIVELEVPQKVHPIVDLTNNSPESDNGVTLSNPNNSNLKINKVENDLDLEIDNSSSGPSDHDYGLSDQEFSKYFEDHEFNEFQEELRSIDLPVFPCSETFNKSHLHDFEVSEERENSEMFEENNNDPNNNLDGEIFNEEPTDINMTVRNNNEEADIIQHNSNLNASNLLMEGISNPIPGCSKDIEFNACLKNKNSLPHTVTNQSTSPIPGCSKDYDDSSFIFNKSIQNDANCIQEIIPWADLETIYSILKKHSNSPNRKQLTLWDLMSEASSQTNPQVNKRKSNNDICIISKKSSKMDGNGDVSESSLHLPPVVKLNNTASSESSNDSQSSRISVGNGSKFVVTKQYQKKQISSDDNLSKPPFSKKENFKNSYTDYVGFSSTNMTNTNNHILIDEAANLMPATLIKENQLSANLSETQINTVNYKNRSKFANPHLIKKERTETIVSGSLKEHPIVQPATESITRNNPFPSYSKLKNVSSGMSSGSVEKEIQVAQKKVEESDVGFQNNGPFVEEDHRIVAQRNWEKMYSKSNESELVKPSKFVFQQKPFQFLPRPNTTYIRPPIFRFTNIMSDMNKQLSVRNDLNYHNPNERHARSATATRATLVQHDRATIKPVQLSHLKNEKLLNKIVLAPAKIENLSSNTPRNNHVLNAQPITINATNRSSPSSSPNKAILNHKSSDASVPLTKFPTTIRNNWPERAADVPVLPANCKPLMLNSSSSVIKKVTTKWPEAPKAQPVATITSASVPMQVVSTAKEPSVSDIQKNLQNSVKEPDPIIYKKLRSIFPAVKKSYVKKICINTSNEANNINKDHLLNILIEHLLKEGHNHIKPVDLSYEEEEQQIISTLSIDEKYEYLSGIFPEADPTYLRDFVEKNCNTEQELQQFIQQKLENRDYPTKQQYLNKIKITEQIKQYTTDFKVENFLEIIPDPFNYFEDKTRKCDYQPIAMEFLKFFFNKNKVVTISRQYSLNKYNVSLTAKALSTLGPDMNTRKRRIEMPTENIPLLQELAFIKNKEHIQNYINTLKTKEENLFKELQEKNLLLTCECCFNDECMPTKSSECNSGHIFCFDCIIRGTESKLADGEAYVRCFANCDDDFSLATLQKVLPPTKFSALLKKRQAAEVIAAGVDGLVSCPFCHFASIPPPEDKVFKCLNPECMKETCRQCKELNHIPLRCDEVIKTDKARRLIEEKMTEALLRTCYECKKQFYKEDGCNKMRCNCGALMCYLCDKPVKGYNHFNPQGGTNTHLCPLWSDDRRLNAEAVRKVAEDMKKVIEKANPNLEIDMKSLLPELPPKTKGPHDDIPNSNQLPEHVRRLAGAAP